MSTMRGKKKETLNSDTKEGNEKLKKNGNEINWGNSKKNYK